MNTIDFVLVALLGLGGLSGFQKGLITGLSKFVGKIAAIAIAVGFHKDFLALIDPLLHIRGTIQPKISGLISKVVGAQAVSGGQFGNTEALMQPMINEATIALTDYVVKILALILLFFLVSLMIDLLIGLIVTPLAKSLSFVNRGGGFAFGLLSTFFVLSLLIGFSGPLFTAANPNVFNISESLLYPWFIAGYQFILSIVSLFAGDILNNPMEAFPFFKGTAV